MQKYKYQACGYIYDPQVGDEDNGAKPDTAFENLPEGWECPLCRAPEDESKSVR